jgi:two-component system chemotaxis sensor kinase CheA
VADVDLTFDISEDELPIFLAETDEQIQILDQGLVRLEREQDDPDLLQAIFRAAHTLKGSAGMIGHKRLVDLTHSLETALDGVRKHTLAISTELIDLCLDAVDATRHLLAEVSTQEASPVVVEALNQRFLVLMENISAPALAAGGAVPPREREWPAATAQPPLAAGDATLTVFADIAPGCIASAARAFQLMMALQDLGQITSMTPNLEQIETAAPVQKLMAQLVTANSPDAVRAALGEISDIERIEISRAGVTGAFEPGDSAPSALTTKANQPLGEYLVEHNFITPAQLEAALEYRSAQAGEKPLLGQALVRMGVLSQDALDQAVVGQLSRLRAALEKEQSQSAERGQSRLGDKTVRTSVERLDSLMNLVGELITDRNRLVMLRGEFEGQLHGTGRMEALTETIAHVGRITDQLQAEVMGIRMLPISNVFNKFPRLVRDLARKAGKQVELVMAGGDTELDRSVIEEIGDPLIHLLRNSVDHGIENPAERKAAGKTPHGEIMLSARHEQGRIIITVQDDGHGIDLEALRASAVKKGLLTQPEAAALSDDEATDLIFRSGLSTAKTVSDISGRGVGMDIVRTNIERLNGNILVDTWPGKGTQFQIILPLTLAIVAALMVRVGKATFAIPIVTVLETLRVSPAEIQTITGRSVIVLRGHVLPVVRLADIFGIRQKANGRVKYEYIVVVRSGKMQVGLVVDALEGEQDVVVKSLSSVVGEVTGISSATILGDGQVALIVEVQGIFKLAAHHQQASPERELQLSIREAS